MPYNHGVYITEQGTSLTVPIEGTAGLQVIVGTAPCNLADDPSTAVNVPKLCHSFAEAKKAVGYSDDFDNYTLCQAIDASFRVFNVAPIILINVLDPATHKTAVSQASQTLTAGKVKLADLGVVKSSLNVSETQGGTALVEGTDYLATFDDAGYCTITDLAQTPRASLFIGYDKLNPSSVTAADIVGTVSGSTETGLELIRRIYPMFNMTPGIISAPGWSHNATVCAALEAKCTGINGVFSAECVVDVPSGTGGAQVYSGVNTAKASLGADSAHTIACWPKAKIGDKVYYMSALVSALMSYTDASNDDVPYRSPSNQRLGITGLCLDDATDTAVILDQDQANTVNSFGVVTALNASGYKCWGNNTAIYPTSTDPKDRWIAVRRMFTWWGNTLIQTYFQKVDSPMNTRLIENIVDSENIRGNGYVARGYVAGARVEYHADENPATDLLNGTIRFHIYLAAYVPAEDIEFILEFDTNTLTESIGGD